MRTHAGRVESFQTMFTGALRGGSCRVVGLEERPGVLPVAAWSADADDHDHALLDLCRGSVLDIGCGPGRMTAALTGRGVDSLGIDVVEEAVTLTVRRGASALHLDVFDEVPGEGRWGTALLADGNIGIGGDPAALLRRVGQLLCPGGRTVLEVAAPGVESRTVWACLESADARSRPFRWSVVGADDIIGLARDTGHRAVELTRIGSRWCAVLESVVTGLGTGAA